MVVGVVDLKQKAIAGALLTALGSLAPHPCFAQVSYEISPLVGVYLASAAAELPAVPPGVGCCHDDFGCGCGPGPVYDGDDLALGTRVTAWVSKRTALDFSLGHWGSHVFGAGDHTTTGSLGLLVTFTSRDSLAFFVVAGGSFVALEGPCGALCALNTTTFSQTDWGPLLGVGARLPFSRTFALRVEAEDHLYTSNAIHEHALVLSAALSVAVSSPKEAAR